MIIGLYVCIPLIKAMISDLANEKNFLTISIIALLILPALNLLLTTFNICENLFYVLNDRVIASSMVMIVWGSLYFVIGHF